MTALLTAHLIALLVPLFVASWRTSVVGLSIQSLLMAWMVMGRQPALTPTLAVTLLDLALVRGLIVPGALYRVMHSQKRPARNDVIPPNMLSWAIGAAMVAIAFRCASWLDPPAGSEHVRIAVAAAGVLLGMLVLATQNGAFSQAVGALRIENAIALFELGGHAHVPVGLQFMQVTVFVATGIAYVVFVARIAPVSTPPAAERPSL